MSEAGKSSLSSTFRTKATAMKKWKPANPPSNRDRLELYALHKQAVSGDAPASPSVASTGSLADKAKFNAWKNKRGLSQEEAMNHYISECDRQMRVYGTAAPRSVPTTPTSTPATGGGERANSVLLTPRGLAAIPLLCAAAAETRSAYLSRMKVTNPSNGWWAKQEPLCADPDSAMATPENLVINIATKAESFSLAVGSVTSLPIPTSVIQAFLWPLHNMFLAVWVALILDSTLIGSFVLIAKTILFGAKTTEVPLENSFSEEVVPMSKSADSLCESHQSIPVRLVGLILMPLGFICDISNGAVQSVGVLGGSMVYVVALTFTWWYWVFVLPWFACLGMGAALMSGWCFALIELAGV